MTVWLVRHKYREIKQIPQTTTNQQVYHAQLLRSADRFIFPDCRFACFLTGFE